MVKKTIQSFLYFVTALLLTAFFMEILIRFSPLDKNLAAFYAQFLKQQEEANNFLKNGIAGINQKWTYHPYYGFTLNPEANHKKDNYFYVDKYGFRNDFDYKIVPPQTKQIGIFGASAVFGESVKNGETIAKQLQRVIDEHSPQHYRIVNFGVGGWQQPQSTFAFIRALNYLEGAIFFDGPNELSFCLNRIKGNIPPDFPIFMGHSFFDSGVKALAHKLHKIRAGIPLNSWTAQSKIVLFSTRSYLSWLERNVHQDKVKLVDEKSIEIPEIPFSHNMVKESDMLDVCLNRYKTYSLTAEGVADKFMKKVLFVVAPQMFARMKRQDIAKRLNKSEKEIAEFYGSQYFEYHQLRDLFSRLWGNSRNKLGPRALDLAELLPLDFEYSRFWNDPAHPRAEGTQIIAKAIFEKLIAAKWLGKFTDAQPVNTVDKENNGKAIVTLDIADMNLNMSGIEKIEWIFQQKVFGRGLHAKFEFPVGQNIVFLKVIDGEGERFIRLPIMVQDNLKVLKNFALAGTASSNGTGVSPALAINGNDRGRKLNEYWWSDKPLSKYYWQLDLGETKTLEALEVVFREDVKNAQDVSNLKILGSNDQNFIQYEILAERGDVIFPKNHRWKIYLNHPRFQYLRVIRTDDYYLALAEFKTLGRP